MKLPATHAERFHRHYNPVERSKQLMWTLLTVRSRFRFLFYYTYFRYFFVSRSPFAAKSISTIRPCCGFRETLR